jgi:hypothetical protein
MASVALKVAVTVVAGILTVASAYLLEKLKERAQCPPRAPNGVPLEEMIRRARNKLGMELVGFLNFAFCGPQGSGK